MLAWIRHFFSGASGAERQKLWTACVGSLEDLLGKSDGTVYHIDGHLHRDGFADVLRFRNYIPGIAYVTCGLIGNERQVPNRWGHYELMMCTKEENEWAPAMLSRLSHYTYDAALQPGDTMDLGTSRPPDSDISALIFARPDPPADNFAVLNTPANLILCIGITADEFAACKNFGSGVMLRMLKEKGVLPFTVTRRESVT